MLGTLTSVSLCKLMNIVKVAVIIAVAYSLSNAALALKRVTLLHSVPCLRPFYQAGSEYVDARLSFLKTLLLTILFCCSLCREFRN